LRITEGYIFGYYTDFYTDLCKKCVDLVG